MIKGGLNPLHFRHSAICGLSCLATFFYCTSVFAAGGGYVMSLPSAISAENIYKVQIVNIDGRDQQAATRYPLSTGKHAVTVKLMLRVYWTPDLGGSEEIARTKTFDVSIDAGTTYQIGAKVNIDAPIESQLDGSFWQPIVYQTY